jgi:hypothetical protein
MPYLNTVSVRALIQCKEARAFERNAVYGDKVGKTWPGKGDHITASFGTRGKAGDELQ